MSDDEDRPTLLYDAAETEETPYDAEQRRGRERMIGLWRAAVQCVTEAAQRQAESSAGAGGDDDEGYGPAPVAPEPKPARALDNATTWVFPTKPGAGVSGN